MCFSLIIKTKVIIHFVQIDQSIVFYFTSCLYSVKWIFFQLSSLWNSIWSVDWRFHGIGSVIGESVSQWVSCQWLVSLWLVVGGFNTTPTFQDIFSTKSPKNPYSRAYSKSEKYLGTFPGPLEFSGSVDTLNELS